jgi:hypothetical protein
MVVEQIHLFDACNPLPRDHFSCTDLQVSVHEAH